jgi:hypothetical protein
MLNRWLRWGLANVLPGLASNHDSPDLCLLSGWDYRLEPPQPATFSFLNKYFINKCCFDFFPLVMEEFKYMFFLSFFHYYQNFVSKEKKMKILFSLNL